MWRNLRRKNINSCSPALRRLTVEQSYNLARDQRSIAPQIEEPKLRGLIFDLSLSLILKTRSLLIGFLHALALSLIHFPIWSSSLSPFTVISTRSEKVREHGDWRESSPSSLSLPLIHRAQALCEEAVRIPLVYSFSAHADGYILVAFAHRLFLLIDFSSDSNFLALSGFAIVQCQYSRKVQITSVPTQISLLFFRNFFHLSDSCHCILLAPWGSKLRLFYDSISIPLHFLQLNGRFVLEISSIFCCILRSFHATKKDDDQENGWSSLTHALRYGSSWVIFTLVSRLSPLSHRLEQVRKHGKWREPYMICPLHFPCSLSSPFTLYRLFYGPLSLAPAIIHNCPLFIPHNTFRVISLDELSDFLRRVSYRLVLIFFLCKFIVLLIFLYPPIRNFLLSMDQRWMIDDWSSSKCHVQKRVGIAQLVVEWSPFSSKLWYSLSRLVWFAEPKE